MGGRQRGREGGRDGGKEGRREGGICQVIASDEQTFKPGTFKMEGERNRVTTHKYKVSVGAGLY